MNPLPPSTLTCIPSPFQTQSPPLYPVDNGKVWTPPPSLSPRGDGRQDRLGRLGSHVCPLPRRTRPRAPRRAAAAVGRSPGRARIRSCPPYEWPARTDAGRRLTAGMRPERPGAAGRVGAGDGRNADDLSQTTVSVECCSSYRVATQAPEGLSTAHSSQRRLLPNPAGDTAR